MRKLSFYCSKRDILEFCACPLYYKQCVKTHNMLKHYVKAYYVFPRIMRVSSKTLASAVNLKFLEKAMADSQLFFRGSSMSMM